MTPEPLDGSFSAAVTNNHSSSHEYHFIDWDTIEMQFEEAISMELDNRHSADESHHSLDAFKDSLIRDFFL